MHGQPSANFCNIGISISESVAPKDPPPPPPEIVKYSYKKMVKIFV